MTCPDRGGWPWRPPRGPRSRIAFGIGRDQRDDGSADRREFALGPIGEHRLDRRGQGVRPDADHDLARRDLHDGGPCRGLLVGVPGRRVERPAIREVGAHRAEDLRRFLDRLRGTRRARGRSRPRRPPSRHRPARGRRIDRPSRAAAQAATIAPKPCPTSTTRLGGSPSPAEASTTASTSPASVSGS